MTYYIGMFESFEKKETADSCAMTKKNKRLEFIVRFNKMFKLI